MLERHVGTQRFSLQQNSVPSIETTLTTTDETALRTIVTGRIETVLYHITTSFVRYTGHLMSLW